MGYFGGGFVFTEEPSWDKLRQLDPQINFRGYKHNDFDVWLLDYWVPAPNAAHDYPFTEADEEVIFEKLPEDDAVKSFFKIRSAVGPHADNGTYGAEWHKFTIAVAKALEIPTYFFAADDEFYDFACHVSGDGTTDTIACRFAPFQVRYSKKHWTITPQISSEDDDDDDEDDDEDDDRESFDEEVLKKLRALPDTTVAGTVKKNGVDLYENPAAEWPSAAGDPGEILGIGDDPYLNIDDDFSIVFERIPAQAPKA